MLRYLFIVVFLSRLVSRDFLRLLIPRQEGTHSVELVEVFRLAVEAGYHQVTSRPAEIAAKGCQPGKGDGCCLGNTM
jgi:hypothetical protein